jgi:hypothetical protein
MEASLEGPCGRKRSRQEVCHSKEQAHRVNLIATRYNAWLVDGLHEKRTPEQREEIARKAAKARWAKKREQAEVVGHG